MTCDSRAVPTTSRLMTRSPLIAVPRRVSAHPERVDHQIEMPAPVEPWPRAHRANHAADQHPDVGRLYAGTDRPRAPGAFDQLVAFSYARVSQNTAVGALPTLRAATDPGVLGGQYYGPGGLSGARGYPELAHSSRQSRDTATQRRLWTVSEELTGVTFPV